MKKIVIALLLCYFTTLSAADADDLKMEVLSILPDIPGWGSDEKALNFIDLVLEVKPAVCVEIGVYAGKSFFPVALALKHLGHGIVFGIDTWEIKESTKHFDPIKDASHIEWWTKESGLEEMYPFCLQMIAEHGLQSYCHLLKMTSEKAAAKIDAIDILHLDGNHDGWVSTQDVMLYLPKVRSGGYIWINDTTWESLVQPWELLAEACDVVKAIDTDKGICVLLKKR